MWLHDGRASYCNRFVRTQALQAEIAACQALWAGILEDPAQSLRAGWGARGRLKDASSTDVLVHGGQALTTHDQSGDAYRLDLRTLATQGPATWQGQFPSDWGISAHPKVDSHTGRLLYFSYATTPPFLRCG